MMSKHKTYDSDGYTDSESDDEQSEIDKLLMMRAEEDLPQPLGPPPPPCRSQHHWLRSSPRPPHVQTPRQALSMRAVAALNVPALAAPGHARGRALARHLSHGRRADRLAPLMYVKALSEVADEK